LIEVPHSRSLTHNAQSMESRKAPLGNQSDTTLTDGTGSSPQ
jgi:hypothetical protein